MSTRRFLLVTLLISSGVAARARAAPATSVVRLRVPPSAFGYANWLSDGTGFVLASDDQVLSFDADGNPRRDARSIAALTQQADLEQGGSRLGRDSTRWAALAQPRAGTTGGFALPYVVNFAKGTAKPIHVDAPIFMLDWTADGFLVGAGWYPPVTFIADADGDVFGALCPSLHGRAVHVHPDGRRIGVAADKLYITTRSCAAPLALTPDDGGALRPRIVVTDFAFSPSGTMVAMVVRREDRVDRLWVMSLDGQVRVDAAPAPAGVAPITWLDEETLVFGIPNGPKGTSQPSLTGFAWRTRSRTPLIVTKPTCSDTLASASPRGGRLVFQRLCDDPKDSFMGLVRTR
jgi:hypothetical protein